MNLGDFEAEGSLSNSCENVNMGLINMSISEIIANIRLDRDK